MASANQVPSSASGSNKNLHDVLRSLSQRSLKRKRMQEIEEDDYLEELPAVASSTQDHDQEDRQDRFVQLASTILYVDSSCRKNVKRKWNADDAEASSDTKPNTTSSQDDSSKPSVKKEKDDKHSSDIVYVHIQSDLDRYKALFESEKEQIQHIRDTPNRIRQEQVNLWGLYKYGLNKIKNLNDLSKAPDAIMPGNFGQ